MPVEISEDDRKGNKIFDLAVRIMQAKFPDYLSSTNAQMRRATPGELPSYVGGDFHPDTKEIRINTPSDLYSGFTTDKVIETVGTMMHEVYHARDMSKEGKKTSEDRSIRTLTGSSKHDPDFWKKTYDPLIRKAEEQGLPSIDSRNFFGNTAEFMATAVPMLDMKDRGIQGKYLENIENIIRSSPEIENVIKANKYPEVPTLKGK